MKNLSEAIKRYVFTFVFGFSEKIVKNKVNKNPEPLDTLSAGNVDKAEMLKLSKFDLKRQVVLYCFRCCCMC